MKVKYTPQTLDSFRTEENQAVLLVIRARIVWAEWCRRNDNGESIGVQGQDEKLDNAMRALYRQIVETDVFYSGKHS